MIVLAIDGGTSNTRARVVDAERGVVSEAAEAVGVAHVAKTGDRAPLRAGALLACEGALAEAETSWKGVDCVVASGMITSPLGLCEIAHLPAPAGKEELARASAEVELEGFPRSVLFIPGVEAGEGESIEIIRGEEVEVVGLGGLLGGARERTFVFAGSHGKVIGTDASGRVVSIFTFLFGELMRAVSNATILAAFVPDPPLIRPDGAALLAGLKDAREHGLGHALFRVRVMGMANTTAEERGAFLFGACAAPALGELGRVRGSEIVVCAAGVQGEALARLLAEEGLGAEIVPEEAARRASAAGALAVAVARARL